MNIKVKNGLLFLTGVATGIGGTIIFVKLKWQKSFDAKRNEMIQYFEKKKEETTPKDEPKEEPKEEVDEKGLDDMKKVIAKQNYAKISSSSEKEKNESPVLLDTEYSDAPYEIDPREFGAQEMYGMLTFHLHNDGEMVTDKYETLDDESIDNYIGLKNLEKLADLRDADPELDAFYVRNDRLKIDCEILIESGV